jgi:hypothetical protein
MSNRAVDSVTRAIRGLYSLPGLENPDKGNGASVFLLESTINRQQDTIDHLLDLIEDLDSAVSVRHKDIDDLEQIDAAILRLIQSGEAAQRDAEDAR